MKPEPLSAFQGFAVAAGLSCAAPSRAAPSRAAPSRAAPSRAALSRVGLGCTGLVFAGLVSAGLLGCESKPADQRASQALGGSEERDAQSPSAKIFPAPLPGDVGETLGEGGASSRAEVKKQAPRSRPTSFPLGQALSNELPVAGVQLGVVLKAHFAWPGARASVDWEDAALATRPELLIELFPEQLREGAPARARVLFASALFSVPEGTELRGRADRYGFAAVWPDGRSYRLVSQDALHSLFQDRRVDRMPALVSPVTERTGGRRLDRDTEKVLLKNALGALTLEQAVVPEAGGGGELLCRLLLGLVRAELRKAPCDETLVPLAATYHWPGGTTLEFVVDELVVGAELPRQNFAVPPVLSIYKPGELPPQEFELFDSRKLGRLFPQDPKSEPTRFFNHHDRPLYLALDGLVVTRVQPGRVALLRLQKKGARYQAFDFLRQVEEAGGPLGEPGDVALGEAPPGPVVAGDAPRAP